MVKSSTTSITPAQHAATHVIGGTDPLTDPLFLHATRHAVGGADEVAYNNYSLTNDILSTNAVAKNTIQVVYTMVKESTYHGADATIRVSYDGYLRPATQVWYRLYVNGVAIGTANHPLAADGTWTTYYEDITVTDGDAVQVYAHSAGANNATVRNLSLLGITLFPSLTDVA